MTLSELVKIVKVFPINDKNHVNYEALLDKLGLANAEDTDQITFD